MAQKVIEGDLNLQTYLKEINRYPLLIAEEEIRLARKIHRGDKEARDKMTRSNLRLVVSIAKAYVRKGLPLAEHIEEGNIGLIRAVEGFNPRMGCRFSTYATWWIRQAIRRSLTNKAKTIRVPAYMVEMIAKWKTAHTNLMDRLNREPTWGEIAKAMDISPRRAGTVKRAIRAGLSSGQTVSTDFLTSLNDMLEDVKTPPPYEEVLDASERDMIQQMLKAMDEREAQVLRLRYGLDDDRPHTLKEIGETLKITRERVRQIETQALLKLNEIMTESAKPART